MPMLAAVDTAAEEAIRGAWAAIASPGSFFTGAERVAFAAHARAARGLAAPAAAPAGMGADLPPLVAETVARVAAEAMASRSHHVQAWEDDGRDVLAYVELVSVVAQAVGIDSYRIGLGQQLDALPEPVPGAPQPAVHPDAKKMNAWVPTVGIALAPSALSALPAEKAAKQALATAWYIADDVVHRYDAEPGRELSRPQLELVAARTSWLNECFF